MERMQILNKIKTKLAIFETEVRIADKSGEYDINRHAQTMLIPILNIVYDCDFQNLDFIEHNFPAIDLGDPNKRLSVQVTSTASAKKVADSLKMFNKHELGKLYSELIFYYIKKTNSLPSLSAKSIQASLGCLSEDNIHFLTNDTLYEKIASYKEIDTLRRVLDILQAEYPEASANISPVRALTPIPPYDHEAGLIGRDNILSDIRTVLANSFQVIVLSGPGGIGKTSLAAKLCQTIKSENAASTAWITYTGDIKSDLLKLELYRDLTPIRRETLILDYLDTTQEPLYLFIDNNKTRISSADIALINQFAGSIRVIITSRNRINAFKCIKLSALDESAAISLYEAHSRRSIPEAEMDAFKQLLKHTSSNTLLVELLAKFAYRNNLTLTTLLKRLETEGILSLSVDGLETVYEEKPMPITDFLLRLYDLSELSETQKQILKFLSIFPAERPISLEIIKYAAFDMAALQSLSELGWIKRSESDETSPHLYLHSIVKDVISAQNHELIRFENYGNFLKKISDTHHYLGRNISFSTAQTNIIIPEAAADYRLKHKLADKETAELCLNLSRAFNRNGDLEKAEKYAKKARGIYQKTCGENSLSYARALSQYATILSDLGLLDRALRLAHDSLKIRKQLSDSSAEASSYDLLGTIYGKAGKYKDAQQYLETALSIRQKTNSEAADTANTLHHLGIIYAKTGKADEAVCCLKKALDIREVRLGRNHFQTASSVSRLGDVYRASKDFQEALNYYEQSLGIFKALSAAEHPFAESTHLGLGYCYKELDEREKAAEAFRLAYKICLAVYGPQHERTLEAEKQMC